ncbi:MAG: hypothetical protein HFE85_01775 [Clostridiales bacterium]|nr:hypothetical protein [Clostridiales bacterium]
MEAAKITVVVMTILLVAAALIMYGRLHRMLDLPAREGKPLLSVKAQIRRHLIVIAILVMLAIGGILLLTGWDNLIQQIGWA